MSLYRPRKAEIVNAIQYGPDESSRFRFLGWVDACDIRLKVTSEPDTWGLIFPSGKTAVMRDRWWIVRYELSGDFETYSDELFQEQFEPVED